MGFEISGIINNKILQDIAFIADKNNSGSIDNLQEGSIFLQRVKELQEQGVISKDDPEYKNILNYCPQEIVWGNGKKIIAGKEDMPANEPSKLSYVEQLNKDVDFELNRLGLEKNEANIEKVMGIIKTKKDLEIQIKLCEAKIENLKNLTVEEKYKDKELKTTMISMGGGTLAGAAVGFKIGMSSAAVTLNPIAVVGGALLGGFIGGVVGCASGLLAHKLSINPAEFEKNRQEQIAQEQSNLEDLKKQLENL